MRICSYFGAAAVLAAGLMTYSGAAASQDTGGVTIYPVVINSQVGMDKQMAILHASASNAIENSPDHSLGKGKEIMFGIPANSMDFMGQADSLFSAAKTEYENFELDSAVQKLEQTMTKLESGAAYLDDMAMPADVLYYLGVCHSFNGDMDSANAAFVRAYALAPDRKPDPNVFPPDVITMYEEAIAGAGSMGTGSISVSSDPASGHVYLDGKYMGLTPVTINNVVTGKHFVKLEKPGFQYFGNVVTVSSGKSQKLEPKLFPAYNASKVSTLAEGLPALLGKGVSVAAPSLAGIADQLGVQQLLVVWVTSGDASTLSVSYLVYDKARGAMVAQRQGDAVPIADGVLSVKADELSRNTLAAALLAGSSGTGEVIMVGPPTLGGGEQPAGGTGEGPAVGEKKKKKWWFWVALVGGAVVVGGATVAGVCLGTDACQSSGPNGPGGTGDVVFEF